MTLGARAKRAGNSGEQETAAETLAPAPTPLRPLQQVGDVAEAIGDSMFRPVTHQEKLGVAQLCATERTTFAVFGDPDRLDRLACLPVRALNRPGNDVLQAAEDRSTIAGMLREPVAVIGFDGIPAPGAFQVVHLRSAA